MLQGTQRPRLNKDQDYVINDDKHELFGINDVNWLVSNIDPCLSFKIFIGQNQEDIINQLLTPVH